MIYIPSVLTTLQTGYLINRGDIVFDERVNYSNNQSNNQTSLLIYNQTKTYRAGRVLPHEYFTEKERVVWRNLAAWKLISSSGWIEYPGPSDWWPEDYDYAKHGWVPDEDAEKSELAYSLMTDSYDKEIPAAFEDFKLAPMELTMK